MNSHSWRQTKTRDAQCQTSKMDRSKGKKICASTAPHKKKNFLRQFRDRKTRDFKELTAIQFMDIWAHYDKDCNGYIEGHELEEFLMELISSASASETSQDVVSRSAFEHVKEAMLDAFDENKDGRIEIGELAEILPMEQNFLLLFRRDNPLESSVEFMKVWREFDEDHSGFIEADELKNFLYDLLRQAKRDTSVSEEQLIVYADTMLQLFDKNKDGKLQLSEMAKLLPVKENFLCRPVFKGRARVTTEDIDKVFHLYDRDHNSYIENEELHGFLKDLMELVTDDYDTADLIEYKRILLDHCDNTNSRINSTELKMILTSMSRQWTIEDDSSDDGKAMPIRAACST